MTKPILMIICSVSGSTTQIGELIAEELEQFDSKVKIVHADEVTKEDIESYDHILLGTYTYSMVSKKKVFIPFELEDLLDFFANVPLDGKKFALFGSCDYTYDVYGGALDLLADELREFGEAVMPELLKIELDPDTEEDIVKCKQFAKDYFQFIVGNER